MGTPLLWRLGLAGSVVALVVAAYGLQSLVGPRGQAAFGMVAFLAFTAMLSSNLRQVRWQTIAWGIGLQFLFAFAIIHFQSVRDLFEVVGKGFQVMIQCSDQGADFVFGSLLTKPDGPAGFVFACKALPPIIFVSSFFSVLYHLGVLQFFVRLFARVMTYLMQTSGAETLSVAANVFMGQTEAPLIVKPFVPRMTKSELLTLMGSGMAHISGGMMAIYIGYDKTNALQILCTCVMACPASLYLTKLLLPETETPETAGNAVIRLPSEHPNMIAAAAAGVKDGLYLALNVAAMLIAFLAFIALCNAILGGVKPQLIAAGVSAESLNWLPDHLSLQYLFGKLFAPVAFLIGVESKDTELVGGLLGVKLAANEHIAFLSLTKDPMFNGLELRSKKLAVYALTGFANFASVGIVLGGIGAMAEGRKADLARLSMRALYIGFVATLMNAAIAGLLTPIVVK